MTAFYIIIVVFVGVSLLIGGLLFIESIFNKRAILITRFDLNDCSVTVRFSDRSHERFYLRERKHLVNKIWVTEDGKQVPKPLSKWLTYEFQKLVLLDIDKMISKTINKKNNE